MSRQNRCKNVRGTETKADLSKTAIFSASGEPEKWPLFPRLKRRGPIEAPPMPSHVREKGGTFPRLKRRGPIEANNIPIEINLEMKFPRLKRRGPIEAMVNP